MSGRSADSKRWDLQVPKDARIVKMLVNRIMAEIETHIRELEKIKSELLLPSLEELDEMEAEGSATFEVYFAGLLGLMCFYLSEAVEPFWSGYRKVKPSNFCGIPFEPNAIMRGARNEIERRLREESLRGEAQAR